MARTYAQAINNSGKIVLLFTKTGVTYEAALYDGKKYKTIDVPNAMQTFPYGINTAGDVIYQWMDRKSVAHGAVLHGGKCSKFNYPKAAQTSGSAISDENLIVGWIQRTHTSNLARGFKATYQ